MLHIDAWTDFLEEFTAHDNRQEQALAMQLGMKIYMQTLTTQIHVSYSLTSMKLLINSGRINPSINQSINQSRRRAVRVFLRRASVTHRFPGGRQNHGRFRPMRYSRWQWRHYFLNIPLLSTRNIYIITSCCFHIMRYSRWRSSHFFFPYLTSPSIHTTLILVYIISLRCFRFVPCIRKRKHNSYRISKFGVSVVESCHCLLFLGKGEIGTIGHQVCVCASNMCVKCVNYIANAQPPWIILWFGREPYLTFNLTLILTLTCCQSNFGGFGTVDSGRRAGSYGSGRWWTVNAGTREWNRFKMCGPVRREFIYFYIATPGTGATWHTST